MQLIRKLLYRNPARTGRNRLIRGLSTAELVGIIVVVGILGALGATYISGLVTSANKNTGTQNAITLSTLANSYVTSGGSVATWNIAATTPPGGDATAAIAALNAGVTSNAITYQMTPAIANPGNYTVYQSGGPTGIITFVNNGTP
jgi:hypothetical protein